MVEKHCFLSNGLSCLYWVSGSHCTYPWKNSQAELTEKDVMNTFHKPIRSAIAWHRWIWITTIVRGINSTSVIPGTKFVLGTIGRTLLCWLGSHEWWKYIGLELLLQTFQILVCTALSQTVYKLSDNGIVHECTFMFCLCPPFQILQHCVNHTIQASDTLIIKPQSESSESVNYLIDNY